MLHKRKLIHIDMDAFFASVEQNDNRSLKGKAVIVGGCSKRGVVCAASYEARKFGIRSAMSMEKAKKFCPHGIYISPRFERYVEISKKIMEIFHEVTDLVEPLSLDEAFLDVTINKLNMLYASSIASLIKKRIKENTGLIASAGVGPNKFVAKIASDYKKPDGLVIVTPEKVNIFLDPLPVGKILGVGKVTEKKMHDIGVKTIYELSKCSLDLLNKKFGKAGSMLYNFSRGIDNRPVNATRTIKSMGEETTFEEDLIDISKIKKKLCDLISVLNLRLEKAGIKGKTITLKVKYHDFSQITRSRTLWFYTRNKNIIEKIGWDLFSKTKIGEKPVRLIGVTINNLLKKTDPEQLQLFNSMDFFV